MNTLDKVLVSLIVAGLVGMAAAADTPFAEGLIAIIATIFLAIAIDKMLGTD